MHELNLRSTFPHGLEVVLLSTSIVMVLAHRKSGREFTERRKNPYNVNVSFTLMWNRTHSAGKYAAARNTSAEPGSLRTTPPEPMKETSVVPEMGRA